MVKMVIQVPSCECAPLCTCSMVESVLEELSSLFEHQWNTRWGFAQKRNILTHEKIVII